jgi:hypothetical protein
MAQSSSLTSATFTECSPFPGVPTQADTLWRVSTARTVGSIADCSTTYLLALSSIMQTATKLDCRRSNLRFATRAQNGQNARLSKRNTTGLKGVCWNASRQLFAAEIRCSGQRHHLGRFATADQAKDARDRAAVALHGEFARSA